MFTEQRIHDPGDIDVGIFRGERYIVYRWNPSRASAIPYRVPRVYEEARRSLRRAREKAGLTQAELGRLASSSESAIRSYESENVSRQRNPNRAHLESILKIVYASRDEATSIMEGFGYSVSRTLFPPELFPDYFFSQEQLDDYVERVPWPEFVVNTAVDIVAANKAAERLWGTTLTEERARSRNGVANLLAVASQPRIAERLVNWDECLRLVLGTLKGTPERPEALDQPSNRLEHVLQDFAGGNPAVVSRLVEIWSNSPPLPAKVRWDYPVVWRDPEAGELRFHAIVSTASEPAGLAFNDWHPADAGAWGWVDGVRVEAG